MPETHLGPEYPIEAVRNAFAELERAYWLLFTENERLREALMAYELEINAALDEQRAQDRASAESEEFVRRNA
jgi:hypothetical protein